jgi:C-terminal processing protease CtpA/Prc
MPIIPPRRHSRPRAGLLGALLAAAALLAACSFAPPLPVGDATDPPPAAAQPLRIAGRLAYSNDTLTSYHTRHAVALVSMHGFVARDRDWAIPGQSLVFGALALDQEHSSGTYSLLLPARPAGIFDDIDHDDAPDQGVQVFAVAYWPDPFTAADRHQQGWPTAMTSTVIDSENHDEVTGGKLVVWAADERQDFPSDFGPDGRLFTGDDPLQHLAAGYSVIDLDAAPFAIDRSEQPSLLLHEQQSDSVKDLAGLGYVAAFQRLYEQLHREYAFNGIAGKEPDWAALYARVAPMVAQAEQDHDAEAFYLALRAFVNGFHDGHVSLDGGDLADKVFDERFAGGYGFAIRQADGGRYVVVHVTEGGPAERAGIRVGAVVAAFGGAPIGQAVAAVESPNGPYSTELALRYDQARYLLRAPVGDRASVAFASPGAPARTAELEAADERDSLRATSLHRGADPTAPPVEYWLLDSELGYVRVNTNDDDLDLIDELFARALDSFEYHEVPGLIVDMRQNDGGATLDLAGYLADEPIPLGQLEYYSEKSGKFEPAGEPDAIEPIKRPYHFKKLAVLVGQGCFSACEIEAYGFSKLPGAIVVGHEPTAGVEAEVSQGQFELPEDIWLQAPTGRMVQPDGSLFLEGAGVAPTLRVPLDAQALLSDDDPVLRAAEKALLK